jgi:PAS domain S-box-containing protein
MSRPLRLLLIEDSEGDAELIVQLLTQANFTVAAQRVDDAEGFRRALADSPWDIIVADYHLPSFDAPGALRILQELGADIPCIVVSGMMGEETAVEMMKSGAQDYVTKNNLARLAPAVARELADAEIRRDSRRTQEELHASEERLALAVEATQIGAFDYNPESGALVWSDYTRRHFGVSPEREISFEMFVQSIHPADRDAVLKTIQKAMRIENGGEFAHEYRVMGIDDKRERWVSTRGRVFFDEQMGAVRVIGVVQNVTEQKRLEQQIVQSQKLESLGRLAGSIGREFNNLFAMINSYTLLMLSGLGPGDTGRTSMEQLSKTAVQAGKLARRLVACSREQSGDAETIRVNDFVKDYESILRLLLGEAIQLELSLDPRAGAIRAHPGQVGQALIDLVGNSKDAMPNGGKVTIRTSSAAAGGAQAAFDLPSEAERFVELSISDSGIGMSPDVQAHLFEPFFTTKEPGKGTGLGLSTVYGIVQQSQGDISVSSEPGRGTTFTLKFPGILSETPTRESTRTGRSARGPETILLVEDELGVRNYLRLMLERNGFKVLEAANGAEALDVVRAHAATVHLLLTDLVMPLMGGLDLMEKFGSEFPHVPVLFMSAYTDQIIRHWSALTAYIQKPFHISDLLTQVRDLLDRSASESISARESQSAS